MCTLYIKRNDGEMIELLLSSDIEVMDYIDKDNLLLENYSYTILFKTEEDLESVELIIGDFVFEMSYIQEEKSYKLSDKTVFEGCFDLTRIGLVISSYNSEEKIYCSPYIRVASSKQTISKIIQMIEEIEKNYPQILSVCFSKNYKESGRRMKSNRTIWNTIAVLDEIIQIYNDNFSLFSNYRNIKVVGSDGVIDAYAMRNVNQSSLNWLVRNPNNLVDSTREKKGIKVGKKYYMPEKIYSPINNRSSNTYENQIILGFLKMLKLYLADCIAKFRYEIQNARKIPNEIIMKIPNTHDLTGRCVQVYYEILVQYLLKRQDMIDELFYKYKQLLECDEHIVNGIPKLTNIFKQVKQYRLCYEYILKWFEQGEYSFDNIDYIFRMKNLSKIFEYLCLIRIQEAFVEKGYKLLLFDRIKYFEKNAVDTINNKYEFGNSKYRIILYYEPYLYCDKFYDEIQIYSTGFNFSKGKWSAEYWNPDFLIKIESDFQTYYYVLDAKFSNYRNVRKYHIKELILKYGTQLASKDKSFSEIIGVGALYLDNKGSIDYFKRYYNHTRSFPLFFCIDIGEGSENNFADNLEKLLEQIDYLESNRI